MTGVSVVVPVRNGGEHLREVLESIACQADGRPLEIIAVEDGSDDGSPALLDELAGVRAIRIVSGPRRGAAAAVNTGVRLASHPIVCQVDQDVVLGPDWVSRLVTALEGDPRIAAAQGRYTAERHGPLLGRVMGLDLEQRYAALGSETDHVCTGNTAYRAEALHAVHLLDETLGYGYDNDLSYRLQAAGYRLVFCRAAQSRHRWRTGLLGYLRQQYGFGYGRLDVVHRHPARLAGDRVSGWMMMAHPLVLALALGALLTSGLGDWAGRPTPLPLTAGIGLLLLLLVERSFAGVRAWRRFGDPAALLFPVVHLARDVAWLAAALTWTVRRILRRPRHPAHSMVPRTASR